MMPPALSTVDITAPGGNPTAASRPLRRWLAHRALRAMLAVYLVALRVASAIGLRRRPLPTGGCDILVTGTFYSDNWVRSHLCPLSRSSECRRIRVVSTYPVPPIDKVEIVAPPRWLVHTAGSVGARLATFAWVAVRSRPDIVAGFHLLLNGLAAALVGRLAGARAAYFCVGGPAESIGGGLYGDNRLFAMLPAEDAVIEQRLHAGIDAFDFAIAMGSGTARYYREHGIRTPFYIVGGGLDGQRFERTDALPTVDVVFTGRLAPVKRLDLLLRALARVREILPGVTAVIVGDGELRGELERLCADLGLSASVSFVGYQQDVAAWLTRARVFVLPSDSEGLSLALMEAMRCGLPAIVSRTGDLDDLVEHGVNGYLVSARTPEAFAEPIAALLADAERRSRFGAAARKAASRYDVEPVARLWDGILAQQRQATSDAKR
jgi:glycosyltransferase involved in cell wall biosynthesis